MSMKAMEELLPASRFMRVHRSYIVQKNKIRIIDRGRIVFGKNYIPISDSYKQAFQEFLRPKKLKKSTNPSIKSEKPSIYYRILLHIKICFFIFAPNR